ncbi:hypothetical protein DXG01_005373 [Tephrocybe rancida]|nr:hypothetical protein DXG01_005373 [Tephrocybe rancida]
MPAQPVVERLEASFDQLLSCAIQQEDEDLCEDVPHSNPDNDFEFEDSDTCTADAGLVPPMMCACHKAKLEGLSSSLPNPESPPASPLPTSMPASPTCPHLDVYATHPTNSPISSPEGRRHMHIQQERFCDASGPSTRWEACALHHKECRSRRRTEAASVQGLFHRRTRGCPSAKALHLPNPFQVSVDAVQLGHTGQGSWIRKRGNPVPCNPKVHSLLRQGFKSPRSIADAQGRHIVGLCGRPVDPDWDEVIREATATILKAGEDTRHSGAVTEEQLHHCRGSFLAMFTGVTMGTGMRAPANKKHTKKRGKVRQMLLDNGGVKHLAGFQSSAFVFFAPKLYKYYQQTFSLLCNYVPNLEWNFTNSIFPACTFNCGPHICTFRHVDWANLPFGLCMITALGDYDPHKGGDIILYDLKLIIEFPPGYTIAIPSGSLEHGNIGVAPHET